MISSVELGLYDVLVMYLNVEQLPAKRVEELIEKAKAKLTETFGADQKILIIPVHDRTTELAVVKR